MKYLKKALNGMVPYSTPYLTDGIILNANESPFNIPDEIKNKFIEEIKNLNFNRYPDMNAHALKDAIAKAYNVKINNIALGVGSDEILQCLFNAVIEINDYVCVMDPSFSMYAEYAHIYQAKPIFAKANDDFSFNLDNVLNAIKEYNPKLVIICSPNNPTGIKVTEAEIRKILSSTSNLVIVDEAYGEFSDECMVKLIKEYDNLIVLKTLSKFYSAASIRLGIAFSNLENINLIDTVRSPYNINTLTQTMAKIIIENMDLYKDRIEYFNNERDRIYNELIKLNVKVYKSYANFLWMELNTNLNKQFLDNNIYVRILTYNNKKYFRVSLGTKDENNKFLEVIKNANC